MTRELRSDPSRHRREDSWHDVDVFQTYRSNHHKFLDFTSEAAGSVQPCCIADVQDRRKALGTRGVPSELTLPSLRLSRSRKHRDDNKHDALNDMAERYWNFARVSILLAAVGTTTALLTATTDLLRLQLKALRVWIVGIPSKESRTAYVLFSVICALASCVATHLLCPAAAGSGVPEMKTILSGIVKPTILSVRALVAKQVGLVLALAAGLSIGQEGPNVHIACAVADLLMRHLSCFQPVVVNEAKRLDVLGAACAGGVAASFGTPFGGAIFSIEITASTYNIQMLPQALWCALAGALALQSAGLDKLTSIFNPDSTGESRAFSRIDLAAFVGLGVFCGLLGCCFVWLVSSLAAKRNAFLAERTHEHGSSLFEAAKTRIFSARRLNRKDNSNGETMSLVATTHDTSDNAQASRRRPRSRRWLNSQLAKKLAIVLVTTLLVAPMAFEDLVAGLSGARGDGAAGDDALTVLFAKAPMDAAVRRKTFWYAPYKLLATVLSVALPLPVGVFKPTLTCGAAIGRAFGELLHAIAARIASERWLAKLSPDAAGIASNDDTPAPSITEFLPWEYAVVGASAFAAGVTRALSTAVIFLELAGENHLRLPLLIATLVAHFIGNCFTKNIYDALLDTNGTPQLPDLPASMYFVQARAFMQPVASVQDLWEHFTSKRKRHRQQRQAAPASFSSREGAFEADECGSSGSSVRWTAAAFPSTEGSRVYGGTGDTSPIRSDYSNDGHEKDIEDDDPAIPYIRLDSTYAELAKLVALRDRLDYLSHMSSVPVVQDARTPALVGSVLLDDVHSALNAFADMVAASRRDPIVFGAAARRMRRTSSAEDDNELTARHSRSSEHLTVCSTSPLERIKKTSGNVAKPASFPAKLDRACDNADLNRYRSTSGEDDECNDVWHAPVHFVVNHGGKARPVSTQTDRPAQPFFAYAPHVSVLLDASPYQLVDTMDLAKLDLIFRTLKVNHAHVTCAGNLVGIVTRSRLRDMLPKDRDVSTNLDRCKLCCSSAHDCDDHGPYDSSNSGQAASEPQDDFFLDELPPSPTSVRRKLPSLQSVAKKTELNRVMQPKLNGRPTVDFDLPDA